MSIVLGIDDDAGPYLGQAIRCLDAQTYRDFEVVAVDDGSTDDSTGILEPFRSARLG